MNRFKEHLKKGEKPMGTFIESCSPYVVEATGQTGLDFIIIDNEHSPIDAEKSADLVKAAELTGLTPFCRVREISRSSILKLLDIGAQGLIIPNVKTVDEVKKLVEWTKYAPIGGRGFCPSRKDGFGYRLNMTVPETMRYFNEEVLLIPQCETVEALEKIEQIANLEGVDGIFIGPFDLSISMGMPGDFENPVFREALEKIITTVHKAGKFTIMFAGTEQKVREAYASGNDSVAYSLDMDHYIQAMRKAVSAFKNTIW